MEGSQNQQKRVGVARDSKKSSNLKSSRFARFGVAPQFQITRSKYFWLVSYNWIVKLYFVDFAHNSWFPFWRRQLVYYLS